MEQGLPRPVGGNGPSPGYDERECWRSLLRAGDEATLARLVVQIAHDNLQFPAAALLLVNEQGTLEMRASIGYSLEQTQALDHLALPIQELERLPASARMAGSVGYAAGNHLAWGLDPFVFVTLQDADGADVGLVLLGKPARNALPPPRTRFTLELFAHSVSIAFLSLQQRRSEEDRVRTIETQKRQLEALLQASANVHGRNLDDVLQRIAISMTTDGGFRRSAVYLRDENDMLHARAFVGVPPEDIERMRVPIPFGMFAFLMRPEMQVSRSFLFDHRKHELPPELLDSLSIPEDRPVGPDEWHALDSLTIPLQDRSGGTIGLISMDEPNDGRFPDLTRIQVLEHFAGACSVAVEQARLYDEIQRLAMTDPLTDLHNRRAFEDALRRELAHDQRHNSPCSILFCDVDGLKQINDAFGHETGDCVLQAMAQVLRTRLREGDLAARVGGDEFVIMLPGTRPEQAAIVAEELRALVEGLGPPAIPPDIRLSISVGVAGTTEDRTLSKDELLRASDRALYAAKTAGRNRVHVAGAG